MGIKIATNLFLVTNPIIVDYVIYKYFWTFVSYFFLLFFFSPLLLSHWVRDCPKIIQILEEILFSTNSNSLKIS